MPGRHASPDPSRFRRDLARLVVLAVVTVVVGVAVVLIIRLLVGEGEPGTVLTAVESTVESGPASTVTTVTSTTLTTTSTTTTTTMPTTTLPPVRDPDRVVVVVLNSTRVTGLAGRVTQRLSDLGYQTLDPDNYPTAQDTSVIWYVEGFEREAGVLAEEITDANVEMFPGDNPEAALTVVLGASYRE